MGMKPPVNEALPSLPTVVSNAKDVGEFPSEGNLASSMKNVEASDAGMAHNLVSCGITTSKNPG